MWQVGYTAKFVQEDAELFALMVIFYFRVPPCSFGGSKCTRCSALAFTLAGSHWAARTGSGADIAGCMMDWRAVAHAVSHSGFPEHSSSLIPKYSFWLEKERLSREMQFVTVALTLRYLPGRFFKPRLHQMKPTALPCCERGKYSITGSLVPVVCATAPSLPVPLLNISTPAGFPQSSMCSSAQASAEWLLSSLRGSRTVLRRDGMLCCSFISPWRFSDVLCVNKATSSSSSFCWRAQQARHTVSLTLGPNWGWSDFWWLYLLGDSPVWEKKLWILFYSRFFLWGPNRPLCLPSTSQGRTAPLSSVC